MPAQLDAPLDLFYDHDRDAEYRDIINEVEREESLIEDFDPSIIDGVHIMWIEPGRVVARRRTAHRHMRKTGYQLDRLGEPVTIDALLDAYHHAYMIAQRVDASDRAPEFPSRAERSHIAHIVHREFAPIGDTAHDGQFQQAPVDWQPAPWHITTPIPQHIIDEHIALNLEEITRDKTISAHKMPLVKQQAQRRVQGEITRHKILLFINHFYRKTGLIPTRARISREVGISPRTVRDHFAKMKADGVSPYPEGARFELDVMQGAKAS